MRGRLTGSGNFAKIAQLLFPDLPRHGHGNLPSGQSSTTIRATATTAKVSTTATMVCRLTI